MNGTLYYTVLPGAMLALVGALLIRKQTPGAKRWGNLAVFGTVILLATGVLIPLIGTALEKPWPALIPIAFIIAMVALFGVSTLLRIRPTKDAEHAKFAAELDYRLTITFIYGIMLFGASCFVYTLGEWISPHDPSLRWAITAAGAVVLIGMVTPLAILSSKRRHQERITRARVSPLPADEADQLFERVLDAELTGDSFRRSTLKMTLAAAAVVVLSGLLGMWLPSLYAQIPSASAPADWIRWVIMGIGAGMGALIFLAALYGPFLFGSISSYRRAFLNDSEWKDAEERMLNGH